MATLIELLPEMKKGRFVYVPDWKENEEPRLGESVGYDGAFYWYTYGIREDDPQRGLYTVGVTVDYHFTMECLTRTDWQLDPKIEHQGENRVVRKEAIAQYRASLPKKPRNARP